MDFKDFRPETAEEVDDRPYPALIDALKVHPSFEGRLLAIDQAVAKCGWAIIEVKKGQWAVIKTGLLKTSEMGKGHIDSIRRVSVIHDVFSSTFYENGINALAVETPPVAAAYRRNNRPESSKEAAIGIAIAWSEYMRTNSAIPSLKLVSAQATKKRWTGAAKATKADLKYFLHANYPEFELLKPNNEDVRDAIALGMFALETPFERMYS